MDNSKKEEEEVRKAIGKYIDINIVDSLANMNYQDLQKKELVKCMYIILDISENDNFEQTQKDIIEYFTVKDMVICELFGTMVFISSYNAVDKNFGINIKYPSFINEMPIRM